MNDLQEKLHALTDMQTPITGPGVKAMYALFTAIVEAIEAHQAHCDLCQCQCPTCNPRRHHG